MTPKSMKQTLKEILHTKGIGAYSLNRMDEVYPGIYVGGEEAAKNIELLKTHGITHVLNASHYTAGNTNSILGVNTSSDYYKMRMFECNFLGVPALDFAGFDISVYFEQSADFIDSALKSKKGKVLVHCYMGVSRSATLVLAYLMMKQSMTAPEALSQVRSKRNVFPNEGFLDQICELESRLRG